MRLIALLQRRSHWSGVALAEALEVSARTLRRDVDRLRDLGYPVAATRGPDGGYRLAPGAVLPPLVIEDDEAVALVVALQSAVRDAGAGVEEPTVRALAKVVQVMPVGLRRRVEALRAATEPAGWSGPGPGIDPAALVEVAQACRDAERLRFGYTTRDGRLSDREVEPFRLVPLAHRWYLVAYDLDRQAWRSFRLDRLAAPRRTGARFRPRTLPAPDAASFVRTGITEPSSGHVVEAVVHASAARVARRVGRWCTLTVLGPDRCLARMTTENLDWAVLTLGATGMEFTVLEPVALRERLLDWSTRLARCAERLPDAGGDGDVVGNGGDDVVGDGGDDVVGDDGDDVVGDDGDDVSP